jgi:hypothetical protein
MDTRYALKLNHYSAFILGGAMSEMHTATSIYKQPPPQPPNVYPSTGRDGGDRNRNQGPGQGPGQVPGQKASRSSGTAEAGVKARTNINPNLRTSSNGTKSGRPSPSPYSIGQESPNYTRFLGTTFASSGPLITATRSYSGPSHAMLDIKILNISVGIAEALPGIAFGGDIGVILKFDPRTGATTATFGGSAFIGPGTGWVVGGPNLNVGLGKARASGPQSGFTSGVTHQEIAMSPIFTKIISYDHYNNPDPISTLKTISIPIPLALPLRTAGAGMTSGYSYGASYGIDLFGPPDVAVPATTISK